MSMSSPPSLPVKKFKALSAFRFFAAVLVVLAHFRYTFWPADSFGVFDDFSAIVSLFFMLSGFMLTGAYQGLQPAGAWRFLVNRIIRIWPLHLLVLALTFLLLPKIVEQNMGLKDSWMILGANLLLVHAWIPIQSWFFSFNTPTWYLSTQFAFYLLFPLLIRNFRNDWPFKLLSSVFLVMLSLWAASRFELFNVHQVSAQGLLYVAPLCRCLEFVLGMCGALCFPWLSSVYRPARWVATIVEVAVLSICILAMAAGAWVSDGLSGIPIFGKVLSFYASFAGLTLLPFFGLIQIFAVERGWLSQMFSWPVFGWLGNISFGMYMLHIVWLHYYLYPIALKPHIPLPTPERMISYWLLLLLSAYLAQRWIEEPIAKKLGSLLKREKRA